MSAQLRNQLKRHSLKNVCPIDFRQSSIFDDVDAFDEAVDPRVPIGWCRTVIQNPLWIIEFALTNAKSQRLVYTLMYCDDGFWSWCCTLTKGNSESPLLVNNGVTERTIMQALAQALKLTFEPLRKAKCETVHMLDLMSWTTFHGDPDLSTSKFGVCPLHSHVLKKWTRTQLIS